MLDGVGTLSWILTLLALNGGLLATLISTGRGNRTANRLLATLVGLISLRLAIYVLGFAGMYDGHPWLTFAPLDASLAFGPLLWLYTCALTRGRLPEHWKRHFIPAAIQIAYFSAAFALPVDAKLDWYRGVHLDVVEPLGLAALLLSSSAYLVAAWRRQRGYQRWLDERFADRDQWRLGWLTSVVAAFAVTVGVAVAAAIIDRLVAPLDYFGRTPVIVASSLLAYALGLLGWRHAALNLPNQPARLDVDAPGAKVTRAGASFATWARRVETEGWWREEGVTLSGIARRLAVSERTLSRGLSEGSSGNFNAFINGLRVSAVMRAIESGAEQDLLTIALDSGFNSKASFNRAFLKHTGMPPSRWRVGASQNPPIATKGEI